MPEEEVKRLEEELGKIEDFEEDKESLLSLRKQLKEGKALEVEEEAKAVVDKILEVSISLLCNTDSFSQSIQHFTPKLC